jgi:hypothetical protein
MVWTGLGLSRNPNPLNTQYEIQQVGPPPASLQKTSSPVSPIDLVYVPSIAIALDIRR